MQYSVVYSFITISCKIGSLSVALIADAFHVLLHGNKTITINLRK